MSRRKDRERLMAMRSLNPDYRGFRGHDLEPGQTGDTPLTAAVCSVCGRRRNVPVGLALEQGEAFVCLSCQQETGQTDGEEESVAESADETPASKVEETQEPA